MSKLDEDEDRIDTVETDEPDFLPAILKEIRELRREQREMNDELRKEISKLKRDLEFLRIEQQTQGTRLESMDILYKKRFEFWQSKSSD